MVEADQENVTLSSSSMSITESGETEEGWYRAMKIASLHEYSLFGRDFFYE